ncbi:MAG: UDP-N-acetylmuramate:L-alanyl-gamma-D-glutamyl-meso-diaminopimelate ligase [Halieaceae bacterium]|jgi:UDP-N-acetylmuramate: L-alanyl-gamma-D-glutamyl-meso-diaminopimelate ligase|nr:UDP-N-acetylmuramate:L-alanyl-gamma-D-glutamyl-meso-diaminopimelate ligase [Halieaceae bacterium]
MTARDQRRLHILGICGTFMGGVALLARELGWSVSGCDANVYPPMSDQLAAAGITLQEGYRAEDLPEDALIVVGNALSRGNPAVEAVLNRGLPYTSGAHWLAEHVLAGRWTLAVAGTHGKTTASSLLAWLLEDAGLAPGFLIGGVPTNFGVSARLGSSDFFVVEADEYDTAFFDKRAKFVHYRPRTLLINNLEFDHADIYPDLAAIQRQFHHLIRCLPGEGLLLTPDGCDAIEATLAQGLWTPRQRLRVASASSSGTSAAASAGETETEAAADWSAQAESDDASGWCLRAPDGGRHHVTWSQRGLHNVANALGAVAAARHVGVTPAQAASSLAAFRGVRRRLELRGEIAGIRVYDDFAHHPTAIRSTIAALAASPRGGRLIAVIEPRSNTMRRGEHRRELAPATAAADRVFWFEAPGLDWSLDDLLADAPVESSIARDLETLLRELSEESRAGDDILIMSNGAFGGIHGRLLDALEQRYGA